MTAPAAAVSPFLSRGGVPTAAAAGQAPAAHPFLTDYGAAGGGEGGGTLAGLGGSRWRSDAPAPRPALCEIELRMHMHRDLDEVSYLFHQGIISAVEATSWLNELWDRYTAAERDVQDWLRASGC